MPLYFCVWRLDVEWQAEIYFYIVLAQKTKFSIKDFLSKCDQIRRKLRIWWHLMKKPIWKTSFFCVFVRNSSYLFHLKRSKKGNDARMILVGYPCEHPFINPSVPNTLFLYPLQIENRKVFCFQELGKGCIGNKWVNNTYLKSK